jgi:predicted ester cyclase
VSIRYELYELNDPKGGFMTTTADLYERWLTEVWGKGDFGVSAELIADDVIDHNAPPGLPPGRAGHDLFCQMIRGAFPDCTFETNAIVASDDHVSGNWTMRGTNTGPLPAFGLEPTGREVVLTGSEIFRTENDQIVEMWHNEDVAGLLMQLGAVPPPPVGP